MADSPNTLTASAIPQSPKVLHFPLSPIEQHVRDILDELPENWTPPTAEQIINPSL